MTEVSVHFNVPERTSYACRLVRKALSKGATLVVTADAATLDHLDRALWAFEPIEFIPHRRLRDGESVPDRLTPTPVWLTEDPRAAPQHSVLVNLGAALPAGFESFARLIEIVSADADDRAAARQRWKHYATRGYPIQRHEVVE
jgi:DNA polymerase-3 subunit chi